MYSSYFIWPFIYWIQATRYHQMQTEYGNNDLKTCLFCVIQTRLFLPCKQVGRAWPPRYHVGDVMKWKNFQRYWPFVWGIHRSPVNSPHKGQWRGALMFSLIYIWINGWVNNRVAGDLRCHLTHYDIIVMTCFFLFTPAFVFFVYGEYHVWTEGANCLCTHERGYFDVNFLSYDVMREINNEITLECVEKQSSGNGLSPVQHQAITWTNSGLLSVECLGTNLNEILIRILSFPFKKMHLNLSSSQMAAIFVQRPMSWQR